MRHTPFVIQPPDRFNSVNNEGKISFGSQCFGVAAEVRSRVEAFFEELKAPFGLLDGLADVGDVAGVVNRFVSSVEHRGLLRWHFGFRLASVSAMARHE